MLALGVLLLAELSPQDDLALAEAILDILR